MKFNKKYIKPLLIGSVLAISGFFAIKLISSKKSPTSTKTASKSSKQTSTPSNNVPPITQTSPPEYSEDYTLAFDPIFYKSVQSSKLAKIPDYETASDIAKKIEGSIHSWPWSDDVDTIVEQIKKVGSKAALSKVSEVYNDLFKKDMEDDLTNFLDKDEMARVIDNIKNLPDYLI